MSGFCSGKNSEEIKNNYETVKQLDEVLNNYDKNEK